MHIRVGICPYMGHRGRSGFLVVLVGGCGRGPYMERWGGASCPLYGVSEEWLRNIPPLVLGAGREVRKVRPRGFNHKDTQNLFQLDLFKTNEF